MREFRPALKGRTGYKDRSRVDVLRDAHLGFQCIRVVRKLNTGIAHKGARLMLASVARRPVEGTIDMEKSVTSFASKKCLSDSSLKREYHH